jgi:small-conductance mechanosensitive channel
MSGAVRSMTSHSPVSSLQQLVNRLREALSLAVPGTSVTLGKILLLGLLIALLLFLSGRLTRWLVESLLTRRNIDVGVRQAVGALFRYAITALGLLVILQTVGIELSALTVLAGALGVGLGLGLQDIVNNFVSGLIILFERPIKVGDRVEIEGVAGRVSRIGSRATTLMTDDNIAIIVPNSQFVAERVTNWSQGGRLVGFAVPFQVNHASEIELLRRILLEAAAAHPDVLEDPAPEVEFEEVGTRALRFKLQVWSTEHMNTAGRLRSDLNFAVWEKLVAAGIEPRSQPHLREDVRMRGGMGRD